MLKKCHESTVCSNKAVRFGSILRQCRREFVKIVDLFGYDYINKDRFYG